MSEMLSLTTELEAVNAILASVGESPINSFEDEFVDAALARKLLYQTLRALQTKGWHWNTEPSVPLAPDNTGTIHIPDTYLRVIFTESDYVVRGGRLYDRTNRTYTFTTTITAEKVIVLLPFDEMPEAARALVYHRAGRTFQDRLGGDQVLHGFHQRDEILAWAEVQNDEAEVAKHNVLTNSALIQRIKGNR